MLFAFPHVSEELSLVQTVSGGLSSIRSALEMGSMDMVAVYLDVNFTVSLKDVVALLRLLQLAFDAVREFVIYVPRGREIVLKVGSPTGTPLTTDVLIRLSCHKGQSLPRRTCYVVPRDHYPGFLLD